MFGLGIRQRLSSLKSGYVDCSNRKLYDRYSFHKLAEARSLRLFFEQYDIDCVFDIGANRGQYAHAIRDGAGFKGHIISVEPVPNTFEQLADQASNDNLWHCENVALSTESGVQQFNVMAGDQFSSFLNPTEEEFDRLRQRNTVEQTIDVQTRRLDDFYAEWKERLGFKRPFLKLDTQGYDHTILMSGTAAAGECCGIQAEVAFKRLYEGAYDFFETMSLMDKLGFSLSLIFPNNGGHFPDCIEQDAIFYNRSISLEA